MRLRVKRAPCSSASYVPGRMPSQDKHDWLKSWPTPVACLIVATVRAAAIRVETNSEGVPFRLAVGALAWTGGRGV
jgi:hypothetical protein